MNAEKLNFASNPRLAAYVSVGAAITMLIGAAFNGASGTDLWAALAHNQLEDYLEAAGKVKPVLIANLSFWILGVFLLGVAGYLLAGLCQQRKNTANIALAFFRVAVPVAIVAFVAMLTVVVQIAPDNSAVAVFNAKVVGWIGVRLDDIATAMIAGAGPFFISRAARKDWMPNWLVNWGYLAGLAAIIGILVLYFPKQYALGLILVPVGLGWFIATGVMLLRKK